MSLFWCLCCELLTDFTPSPGAVIEQVNAG